MNLYRWNSKAMADYYDGEIIVMAKDLKSAKAKVLREYKKKNNSCYYNLEAIKKDLSYEPEVVKNGCLFINGGS